MAVGSDIFLKAGSSICRRCARTLQKFLYQRQALFGGGGGAAAFFQRAQVVAAAVFDEVGLLSESYGYAGGLQQFACRAADEVGAYRFYFTRSHQGGSGFSHHFVGNFGMVQKRRLLLQQRVEVADAATGKNADYPIVAYHAGKFPVVQQLYKSFHLP